MTPFGDVNSSLTNFRSSTAEQFTWKLCVFVFFYGFVFGPWTMAWNGMKWGREDFSHTYPDRVDILGGMDFDFEYFHFSDFSGFQIPCPKIFKLPDFEISSCRLRLCRRRRTNSQIPT